MTSKQTSSGVLPPHRKPSTITDVAQAAGVSRTTVSYVLSGRTDVRVPEDTRRRIMDAAARIGYRRNALAAAFRSGRMNTIGIVAPFSLMQNQTGGNVYYKELLLALAGACSAQGMNALLLSDGTPGELTVSDVTDRRADGVILAVRFHAETFSREAAGAGVPVWLSVGRPGRGRFTPIMRWGRGWRSSIYGIWDIVEWPTCGTATRG
jgi:DNA-binding LacI/PurR family transcriptional regulator